MDFAETAEQAMLREAVGRIAAKYGHDYFSAKVKSGGHSEELWRDVGAAGFLGVSIPERYGGGGMGITELAIVAEELAAHGCPLMLLMVSPAICGTILARFGTPEQRDRWLPGLATGERKMVFAITEPEAGSNSHRLSTTGTRDGDAWTHDLGRAEAGEIANMAKYAAAEAALHALDASIQAHGGNGFTTEYGLADLW